MQIHRENETTARRKVQFSIHPDRIQMRCQWRQVPQVAVTKTAVRVQAHFNDARMQAVVHEMAQTHQQPGQHAPVEARRGGQRQYKRGAGRDRLGARQAPKLQEGAWLYQAGHSRNHDGRQHRLRHVIQPRHQPQQNHNNQADREHGCPPSFCPCVKKNRRAGKRRAGRKCTAHGGHQLRQALAHKILIFIPAGATALTLHLGAGSGFQKADQSDHHGREQQVAQRAPWQHVGPVKAGQP